MNGSDCKASYFPRPELTVHRGRGSERAQSPASGGEVIRLFSGRERFYEPWEPGDE